MWGPPVIRWFINPMNTIVIGTINHSYWSYVHQLSYRKRGPTLYVYIYISLINGGFNGKIIYFYGPFSMAMSNNQRVYTTYIQTGRRGPRNAGFCQEGAQCGGGCGERCAAHLSRVRPHSGRKVGLDGVAKVAKIEHRIGILPQKRGYDGDITESNWIQEVLGALPAESSLWVSSLQL